MSSRRVVRTSSTRVSSFSSSSSDSRPRRGVKSAGRIENGSENDRIGKCFIA